MAYPATAPTLTNEQSVDLIIQSEATIIQGLNELFCVNFVDPVLASTTLSSEDKLVLISNVLNTMACKECTIANILTSAAEFLAVDKNLIPTVNPVGPANPTPCAYCK